MSVELDSKMAAATEPAVEQLHVQPEGFLIELSLDWIVIRASENVDRFLSESHVTLIDEPLGRFVQAQPLHDLRNLFSRLSGAGGLARAYQVRLVDDRPRFDIAFQISGGRVLLEATESPSRKLGEALGSVAGLVDGLSGSTGQSLLDNGARRMRALTGFDSVSYVDADGNVRSESRRPGAPPVRHGSTLLSQAQFSRLIANVAADPVPMFPKVARDRPAAAALLRSPRSDERAELLAAGIRSTMRVPVRLDGEIVGCFECDDRRPRRPQLEMHAAAELFARMFAMRMRIAELGG